MHSNTDPDFYGSPSSSTKMNQLLERIEQVGDSIDRIHERSLMNNEAEMSSSPRNKTTISTTRSFSGFSPSRFAASSSFTSSSSAAASAIKKITTTKTTTTKTTTVTSTSESSVPENEERPRRASMSNINLIERFDESKNTWEQTTGLLVKENRKQTTDDNEEENYRKENITRYLKSLTCEASNKSNNSNSQGTDGNCKEGFSIQRAWCCFRRAS